MVLLQTAGVKPGFRGAAASRRSADFTPIQSVRISTYTVGGRAGMMPAAPGKALPAGAGPWNWQYAPGGSARLNRSLEYAYIIDSIATLTGSLYATPLQFWQAAFPFGGASLLGRGVG